MKVNVLYIFIYMFDNVYMSWNVSYEFPHRENIKLAEVGLLRRTQIPFGQLYTTLGSREFK